MTENKGWSSAAICISSKEISVKEISMGLNVDDSKSFEKGTPVSPRNPASSPRKSSLWMLESGIDNCLPLSDHINALLPFIEEKHEKLNALSQSCHIELFCGYSSGSGQGSLMLGPEILKKLTLIPLELVLDLYPTG